MIDDWPSRLAEPAWLLLAPLAVLPFLLARPALAWPGVGVEGVGRSHPLSRFRGNLPTFLRSLAILLVLLALARPQRPLGARVERSRGVAIVIALDRSASMSRLPPGADGETPLKAAVRVLDAFVARRPRDQIGLVGFANWPDTLCPPTLDHAVLRQAIASVTPAARSEDGTNLGDALAWAAKAALSTPAARRVILLITDGRHEPDRAAVTNPLDPIEAARLARELGLVVHAVGIRTPQADLDEPLLAAVAQAGGGRSLVAASPADLGPVIDALDALEPSDLAAIVAARYREDWPIPLIAALASLILSLLAEYLGPLP